MGCCSMIWMKVPTACLVLGLVIACRDIPLPEAVDGGGDGLPASDAGVDGGSSDGGSDGGTGPLCEGVITAIVRDFRDSHPDFESYTGMGPTKGLVEPQLGDDGKPVFASTHGSGQHGQQLSGKAEFDQWYRDVPQVNLPFEIPMPLRNENGKMVFDDGAFFPINGQGFGNQGRSNNFHFTTEIHTTFRYEGEQVFTFIGDDDLWLFVNGKLALDLGGLHPAVSGTVDFDALASSLGIVPGNVYTMDIFHAERHTVDSNFRIETNIHCFGIQ
jgi:fibro-slime domain-containing protein